MNENTIRIFCSIYYLDKRHLTEEGNWENNIHVLYEIISSEELAYYNFRISSGLVILSKHNQTTFWRGKERIGTIRSVHSQDSHMKLYSCFQEKRNMHKW